VLNEKILLPEDDEALIWHKLSLMFDPGSNRLWDLYHECDFDAEKLFRYVSVHGETLQSAMNTVEKLAFTRYSDEYRRRVITDCVQKNIGIITYNSRYYPTNLREIYNPPSALYYYGDIAVLDESPCLAIVGARRSSAYAARVTEMAVKSLLKYEPNYVIVSGFAMGTDITAHLSAVRSGGKTIAVKASGVDYAYPDRNMPFTAEIAANGVFISEYPPGTRPDPRYFPIRNRIIAALSDGVMVTEGGAQSGSLSTAHLAADFGRDVFVVPPRDITAPECQGNISLLREGATPVYGTRDILMHNRQFVTDLLAEAERKEKLTVQKLEYEKLSEEMAEVSLPERETPPNLDIGSLDEFARNVYDIIKSESGGISAEMLAQQCESDPADILDLLTDLEMGQFIARSPDGRYY
jgi:DNA processing protein